MQDGANQSSAERFGEALKLKVVVAFEKSYWGGGKMKTKSEMEIGANIYTQQVNEHTRRWMNALGREKSDQEVNEHARTRKVTPGSE